MAYGLPCPHCGEELQYNLKLGGKYVCPRCTAIWTYKLNVEDGSIDWYEWFETDKPEGWDEMSHDEQMRYLNIDRLTQSAERFINKNLNHDP